MAKVHFLQDGWGGSKEPYDDTEDNCAPGWPSQEDIEKDKSQYGKENPFKNR